MSARDREDGELPDVRPVLVDDKADCLQTALRLLERAAVKIDPVYHVYDDIKQFLWRMKVRGHK